MNYTADGIRKIIEENRERLFSSYAADRSPNWVADQQTKDIICLSVWLREELIRIGIDDLGRKTQESQFNRYSRSDKDLFELAAQIMNDTVAGNIDRNRKTHHRWG